ncbi:hypothetical protein ZWY2020_050782 [Hordeum vulgare]|nr:hypothetical protein ZWY2020_050782 [Hordeum vulgare]
MSMKELLMMKKASSIVMMLMRVKMKMEISDPMATIGIKHSVNGHKSNRKRVLAPPVGGLQLVKKPSNLHNKPSMSNDSDLQASNKNSVLDKKKETMVHNGGSARQLEKCFAGHKNVVQKQEAFDHSYSAQQGEINSAAHKYLLVVLLSECCSEQETLLQNVRTQQGEKTFAANKVTKKITKGATANSKSAESGSLRWLGASELPVGTKVFLKSLKNQNMDVALATIMSCDPKFKLDGDEIGNEFWVVHVDMALVKTENLVRSRKDCNTLGNAEKTKIAWPSTFIQKING